MKILGRGIAALSQAIMQKTGAYILGATIFSLSCVVAGPANACFGGTERYNDCGDGTVADNKTGLMWAKKIPSTHFRCTDPIMENRNVLCVNVLFSWSDSVRITEPSGTLFTDFLEKLNDLEHPNDGLDSICLANYCDWRVPTIGELRSIFIDVNCTSNPCIDPIFGPTMSSPYWSSSSLASDPTKAWLVDFGRPAPVGVGTHEKNTGPFGFFARAVRDGR